MKLIVRQTLEKKCLVAAVSQQAAFVLWGFLKLYMLNKSGCRNLSELLTQLNLSQATRKKENKFN